MDNHELMHEEAVEIHDSEVHTTRSMNFIQEKPEEVSTHKENGHVNLEESCELPGIDIMLESSVQNVEENNESVTCENVKQGQFKSNDNVKLSNDVRDPELLVNHNKIVEVDNDGIVEVNQPQDLEVVENQVMEAHQDQVIVQATEGLQFETSSESINEEEKFKLHIEDEEAAQECEIIGENGDLNPEEYSAEEMNDTKQFDGSVDHTTITDYVSEDYVHKEEILQDNDPLAENREYKNLSTRSEMQLLNENEQTEGHPTESSFISTAEEKYGKSSCVNSEETEVNEEETIDQSVTYRQQNIINLAAASAEIDMQGDTSRSETQEEEDKLEHSQVESSTMEGVSIILNSGESVESSQIQKVVEESTGEVVEEIYFIQETNDSSLEEHKDNSNLNQVPTVLTLTQSIRTEVNEDGSKSITQNTGTSEKSRNVIQDIFDDWGDENIEEENQVSVKEQDTVEIELNNLLNEKKKLPASKDTQSTSKSNAEDTNNVLKPVEIDITETPQKVSRNSIKDIPSFIPPHIRGNNLDDPTQDGTNSKRKMQSPRLGLKIPGRHLKSQIASPAEVTEVLKERLREKQKDLESPQAADIVFVKKLTQRFATKICAGGTLPVPGLIPLSQSTTRSALDNSERTESANQSGENTDNRELLAILEGDVDPDWSNLKSQTTKEESPGTEGDNTLTKLNPMIEREIALKQLLEMPSSAGKRVKKKTLKAAPNKVEKNEKTPVHEFEKEVSKAENSNKTETIKQKDSPRKPLKENDSQNTPSRIFISDIRIDETRSGRKRKPTEKALEQYVTKRQKMYKARTPSKKIQPEESVVKDLNKTADNNSLFESNDDVQFISSETPAGPRTKEATDKSISLKKDKSVIEKKQSLSRETPSSKTPKKLITKKLVSQRVLSLKKSSIHLQSKLSTPIRSPGRPAKLLGKSVGRPKKTEVTKPRRRGIKEIDKLLQDEGVVNLLYDVGQPRKRRLIPITKSQKKVMDIEKAERDLNLRKKLVKNAVLRLRSSDADSDKIASRSKRMPLVDTEIKESLTDQAKSSGSAVTSPTGFIYPAKIRNAADASVIVRRHSSSSFSSVSGSPRVSIDAPLEGYKIDDEHHGLRSTKRKFSLDKDIKHVPDLKRSKQKYSQNSENSINKSNNNRAIDVFEDKIAITKKQNKKIEKSPRTSEASEVGSNESKAVSKVTTRSNGAALKKVIPKNKKGVKNKSSAILSGEASGTEETMKSQDELSACLAEAATALSSVSGISRKISGTTTGRKSKGMLIFSISLLSKTQKCFLCQINKT